MRQFERLIFIRQPAYFLLFYLGSEQSTNHSIKHAILQPPYLSQIIFLFPPRDPAAIAMSMYVQI